MQALLAHQIILISSDENMSALYISLDKLVKIYLALITPRLHLSPIVGYNLQAGTIHRWLDCSLKHIIRT